MKVQIYGMGHALPARILTNQELEQMVDTSDQWIVERTGIRERRIGAAGTATSDLAYEAARMALERAGVKAGQVDLIIVATATPDMLFPSTACLVQERLQASNAAAFDLAAGCTGFVYALSVAEKFLLSPDNKYILVIGAEMCSRMVDYSDRNTAVLFGDGAGAALVGGGNGENGMLGTYLGAEGSGAKYLYMPAGGSAMPASHETVENKMHYVRMNGQEIFKFATSILPAVGDRLLAQSGLRYEDVDLFVPHQANLRIIKTAIKRSQIPLEKTLLNIHKYGNMSAACIPVALSEAEQEGKLKAGDLVLMIAFGAGLTYGGALLRWGKD